MNPLVSVNMITYNHERHIEKAIQGVLNQVTDFPFNLVIGEDCSSDRTKDIVREYQKKYPHIIKLVTSDANVGMLRNSFRTSFACDGKYIAFCEGDDFWHNSKKLQIQVDFLEQNPSYGMVHSNVNFINTCTNDLTESYLNLPLDLNDDNAYFQILNNTRIVFTPTVCVRSDLLFHVLNNSSECTNEKFMMGDLQLWLELSRLAKVKYLTEPLATYNMHVESASRSKNLNKLVRFEESSKDIICLYLEKYFCPDEVRHSALSRVTSSLLKVAIYANNRTVIQRELSEIQRFRLEVPLTWRERLVCWSSDSAIKFSLVLFLRKISAIKKQVLRRLSGSE